MENGKNTKKSDKVSFCEDEKYMNEHMRNIWVEDMNEDMRLNI